MTTYKEVFQLAQGRGYELNFVDTAKMSLYEPLELIIDAKNIYLLELTLIQKWLRDEEELSVYCDIPVEIYWRYVVHGTGKRAATYTDSGYKEKKNFTTYEEALLEGIAEALKLL